MIAKRGITGINSQIHVYISISFIMILEFKKKKILQKQFIDDCLLANSNILSPVVAF